MRHLGLMLPLLCLTMAGCAPDSLVPRGNKPAYLAEARGWTTTRLTTDPFVLMALLSPRTVGDGRLTIFLEGDGLAYLGTYRVSPDPTPTDPVALRLALAHPGGNVAWLARPCQYVTADFPQPACESRHWTGGRYGPQIVASLDQAIDQIKRHFGARDLVLVGYSGGGALAVLLAARRTDIAAIVTVAAPIDLAVWTETRHLGALTGSLNPADVAAKVAGIRQIHLVGGRDQVVGPEVARAFLKRSAPVRASMEVVPTADHGCCWVEDWPKLMTAHHLDGKSEEHDGSF